MTTEDNNADNTPAQKPDFVPAKFWDEAAGTVRLESLVKSYAELEKKLAQKPIQPVLPETPDAYDITLKDDMLSIDNAVNARLHAKGFTNEQVQEVYDLAAEKLIPMIAQMMLDAEAERELEKVVHYFGGPQQWAKMAQTLLAFGRKTLSPEMLDTMASSYEGIIALHAMMQQKLGQGAQKIAGPATGRERLDDAKLAKMMQDPKYWRDRDPAFIAKVTEGFQDLYS